MEYWVKRSNEDIFQGVNILTIFKEWWQRQNKQSKIGDTEVNGKNNNMNIL